VKTKLFKVGDYLSTVDDYRAYAEELTAEINRLRAYLLRIADDRHSSWSELTDLAKKALAE
jgi:hypothetical protein